MDGVLSPWRLIFFSAWVEQKSVDLKQNHLFSLYSMLMMKKCFLKICSTHVKKKKKKLPVGALQAFLHHFWLVNIMKYLFVEPSMIRLRNGASQTCTTLFFLTPSLIGSINIKILILTNRMVALMGLIKLNKMIVRCY